MFGTRERPMATEDNKIIPIEQYNLKLMSMGFLLDDASPAILRGPMVTRYTQQFLRQVEWGELDYLILDLPPGTGDIQLTIVQTVALVRRHHRNDAAGSCPDRCAQGRGDVR